MKWLLSAVIILACAGAGLSQDELPKGKGGDLINDQCTSCHTLSRITSQSRDKEQWAESVKAMISYGTDLSPDEQTLVIDYLAKYFGMPVNVNKATAAELRKEFELSQKEAEAIVQTRKDKGAFQQFSDLGKVPGLDLKKLEDLHDRIQFN